MKRRTGLSLILSLATGLAVLGAGPAQPEAPDVEVRAIIDRALARAAWAAEQRFEGRFRHTMTQRTRRFDGDGETTEDEQRLYLVHPVRGVPYPWLIAKNGEPVGARDADDERDRWRDFVAALDEPADERDDEEDENQLVFDEALLGRFTARLDGVQALRGRPSFVISFEPKPGKLPVERQIDRALNKSRGELWIDQATYEIARVRFELIERVRMWWGILGSVSDVTGRFERRAIAGDAWLPTEIDIFFHMRVLFSTTRRAETTLWEEFDPID